MSLTAHVLRCQQQHLLLTSDLERSNCISDEIGGQVPWDYEDEIEGARGVRVAGKGAVGMHPFSCHKPFSSPEKECSRPCLAHTGATISAASSAASSVASSASTSAAASAGKPDLVLQGWRGRQETTLRGCRQDSSDTTLQVSDIFLRQNAPTRGPQDGRSGGGDWRGSIVVLVGNEGTHQGAKGGADDDADACFKRGLVMQEDMRLENDSTDARATYIGNLIGIVGDIDARCKHLCNTNRTLVCSCEFACVQDSP